MHSFLFLLQEAYAGARKYYGSRRRYYCPKKKERTKLPTHISSIHHKKPKCPPTPMDNPPAPPPNPPLPPAPFLLHLFLHHWTQTLLNNLPICHFLLHLFLHLFLHHWTQTLLNNLPIHHFLLHQGLLHLYLLL